MRFAWPLIVAGVIAACREDPAPAPPPPGETSSTSSSSSGKLPPTADVTITTETTTFAGKSRKYVLAKPNDYDAAKKYPVVMVLHGNPGNAEGMAAALPFHTISKRDAIVVYPNALNDEWDQYTPNADGNVDVGWFPELLTELGKKLSIDPKRVLGYGYSGGAFMVVQVSCRASGVFSAIGVLAGGGPDEPNVTDPPRNDDGCITCAGAPVAAIIMHGESDGTVTFDSGDYTRKCYARYNGCKETLVPAKVSPCQAYEGCAAGKPVQWCAVPGQDHSPWKPSMQAAWDMFRALP